MAVAQLELTRIGEESRCVLDLVMRLAYNLIDTLGGGESSSPTYMDDFRGRRRHVRQETGAVGQRREGCRGPVRAAQQNDVVGEGVDMPVACEHV